MALLAGGDLSVLLVFAAIGRASHGEPLGPADLMGTALPFALGWFPAAAALGGFGKAAQGGDVGAAARAALKSWAVGVPLGLALRSLAKGYLPAPTFLGITMAVTGVMLVGWRAALAAATPAAPPPKSPAEQLRERKNKRGNPFEFLQLLSGLVRRW